MTLADQKAAARKAAYGRRRAAFDGALPDACGVLLSVLAEYRGVPTAGFMPIRSEIDPTLAMVDAAAYGPVGVPVVKGANEPLVFALWSPGCAMVPGAFGAAVPAKITPMTPEILIVPLLAFSTQGGRLGYGGGFYDRTLEQLRAVRPTLAIGFAFSAQQADDLPLESTDQPLDMIVTEKGLITPHG